MGCLHQLSPTQGLGGVGDIHRVCPQPLFEAQSPFTSVSSVPLYTSQWSLAVLAPFHHSGLPVQSYQDSSWVFSLWSPARPLLSFTRRVGWVVLHFGTEGRSSQLFYILREVCVFVCCFFFFCYSYLGGCICPPPPHH